MVPEKTPSSKKKTSKNTSAKQAAKAPKEAQENLEVANVESQEEAALVSEAPAKPTAPFKEGDDYTLLIRYDRDQRLFVGEVAEIADCKTKGLTREDVIKDLKIKLEDYLEDHRHQGGVPDALFSKTYPEILSIKLSQSVYRKLDLLSRMEKIALDQLATQLLTTAAERRLESGKGGGHKNSQPHNSQQSRHQHHGGRHGGGHNRNRHNQGNLDSRENFMEYVRNLEKGGNRWKK